ncbi:plancitoxin-1-like isoform X1 [Mytilus edulis]|uniref:plancitoxin-1-like isoform X1 n=1 Tax=Mytilus edulis TaxID=6550 RepID=UPI0039EE1DB4
MFVFVFLCMFVHTVFCMQCRSQTNKPVDWFIVYKIPKLGSHPDPNFQAGTGFYYMDNNNPELTPSDRGLDVKSDALFYTLDQIYNNKTEVGYFMYSDHTPANGTGANPRGHAKGVLGFVQSGGFWMIHSAPRFPPLRSDGYKWQEKASKNGQTFLCISLDYGVVNRTGTVFRYIFPYIYDVGFPSMFNKDYPMLRRFSVDKGTRQLHVNEPPWYDVIKLPTKGGVGFFSFSKYGKFGNDLYDGLLSNKLQQNLLVQSWIETQKTPGDKLPSNCSIQYKVYNVNTMRFPGKNIEFATSKDHSKWVVSKDNGNWLCIGDINRQKPQKYRAGGQVCFQNKSAWNSFKKIVKEFAAC